MACIVGERDIKVRGIDLGKAVCNLAGMDEAEAVVFRKQL